MVSINIENHEDDLILVLDDLYIDSRYPGDFDLLPDGKPTLEDAQQFYALAAKVFEDVCNLLGVEKKQIE